MNIVTVVKRFIYDRIPDKLFLELKYYRAFHKRLNLKNPQTFNEKLQWLKLYDRNPAYTQMVDKYEAKKYVAGIIGDKYIIPTLGVWDRFDDIDFEALPDQFVLKTTHDSGTIVICKDKSQLDMKAAKKKLEARLHYNYYKMHREWPYKNVKPRIIAEKYMVDTQRNGLLDYKLMCFNGICKYIFTVTNRFSEEGLNVTWFDTLWNRQPFERHYKADPNKIAKPECLEEMISVAEKLSEQLPFDRIDLYEIDGRIYFGEITFYPGSGFEEFKPEKYDAVLGDCIKLPSANGGYVCIANCFILWLHNAPPIPEKGLTDYKFYTFGGVAKALLVASGRNGADGVKMDFFDMEFRPLGFTRGHPKSAVLPAKPENFERMRSAAEKLSRGIPFLRCDFYEADGGMYFGELTFYPASGLEAFEPESWDKTFGDWLKLPEIDGGGYICVGKSIMQQEALAA